VTSAERPPLTIPEDRWAEQVVVGCAIASIKGAQLARTRVCAADFYGPRHARLFAVTVTLDDVGDPDDRARVAADRAEVPQMEVDRIVASRSLQWDRRGTFAGRVADAAARRRLLTICAEIHNALGGGSTLAEVTPMLKDLERIADAIRAS
jgi:replicative DNA helicase